MQTLVGPNDQQLPCHASVTIKSIRQQDQALGLCRCHLVITAHPTLVPSSINNSATFERDLQCDRIASWASEIPFISVSAVSRQSRDLQRSSFKILQQCSPQRLCIEKPRQEALRGDVSVVRPNFWNTLRSQLLCYDTGANIIE